MNTETEITPWPHALNKAELDHMIVYQSVFVGTYRATCYTSKLPAGELKPEQTIREILFHDVVTGTHHTFRYTGDAYTAVRMASAMIQAARQG